MGNLFLDGLKERLNIGTTENGGVKYHSTLNPVLDLFSLGGSYRERSKEDIIDLFSKAFYSNEVYALRTLFYLRDIRGCGCGERRFFRVCLHWLAKNYPDTVRRNISLIPEYGRWDDLYCIFDTPLENEALKMIKEQIEFDCRTILSEKGSDEQ